MTTQHTTRAVRCANPLRLLAAAILAVAFFATGCVYELDPNSGECCDEYGCYACDDACEDTNCADDNDAWPACTTAAQCGAGYVCDDGTCVHMIDLNNDVSDCRCGEVTLNGSNFDLACGESTTCDGGADYHGACLSDGTVQVRPCETTEGDPATECSCTFAVDGRQYDMACGEVIACGAGEPFQLTCQTDRTIYGVDCSLIGDNNSTDPDNNGAGANNNASPDNNANNSTPECATSADCSLGEICEGGACAPEGPTDCTCSADCLLGQTCEGGACVGVPIDRDGVMCQFDRECGEGGACLDGQCERGCDDSADCPRTQTCGAGGLCVADDGGDNCVLNADCGAGICINGHCLDRCCESEQCESDFACDQGVCRPSFTLPEPQCRNNTECTGDLVCVDAACRATCEGDAACGGLESCLGGYCVPEHELSPECVRSTDCAGEAVCRDGVCLAP